LKLSMSFLRNTMLLLLAIQAGCSSEPPVVEVRGTVTYESQPVTEGTVQFNDESTGHGAEVELRPDGTYLATLPPGAYKVVVLPPYLVDYSSGTPNPTYKRVKNIPAKYHSTATSGLTAEVSLEKPTHDFALAP
jgi:hypothetical protein